MVDYIIFVVPPAESKITFTKWDKKHKEYLNLYTYIHIVNVYQGLGRVHHHNCLLMKNLKPQMEKWGKIDKSDYSTQI